MENQNQYESQQEKLDHLKKTKTQTLIFLAIIVIAVYFIFVHDSSRPKLQTGGFSKLFSNDMVTSNISPISSSVGTIGYSTFA